MKKTYKDNPIGELAEYHTTLALEASDNLLGKKAKELVDSLTSEQQDLLLSLLLLKSMLDSNK